MGYITISDLRDEGVTVTQASNARLTSLIALATAIVDRHCRQWFEPRSLTVDFDGPGTPVLRFLVPVISVGSVISRDPSIEYEATIDASAYRVYNRHLTQNMLDPDDRDDPRLELVGSYTRLEVRVGEGWYWPRGRQNIRVAGVFGYTDPDSAGGSPVAAYLDSTTGPFVLVNGQILVFALNEGENQTVTFATADFASIGAATATEVAAAINKTITGGRASVVSGKVRLQSDRLGIGSAVKVDSTSTATAFSYSTTITRGTGSGQGKTPDLIKHATKLLTIANLTKLGDASRVDPYRTGALRVEQTRDQRVEYFSPRDLSSSQQTHYTGIAEVDNILDLYRRSLSLGSV